MQYQNWNPPFEILSSVFDLMVHKAPSQLYCIYCSIFTMKLAEHLLISLSVAALAEVK